MNALRRPNLRTLLLAALALALLAYGTALAWLYLRQERLLFPGTPLPQNHRFGLGDDVQELHIDVPGARLSALQLRLPRPRGVVFFLHGNAGNLQDWFVNLDFYRRANYDLFMLDYRGYGKSSGRIESEAQLQADVLAAWQQVAPRYAGLKRVIYGRSLGTGLAASLAAQVQPDLTVLVSPYRSMSQLVGEKYPLVPEFLLRYPLRTEAVLPRVLGPVMLVHGSEDQLIPLTHSVVLLRLAPKARLAMIPGAAHNDLQDFSTYRDILRESLDRL